MAVLSEFLEDFQGEAGMNRMLSETNGKPMGELTEVSPDR